MVLKINLKAYGNKFIILIVLFVILLGGVVYLLVIQHSKTQEETSKIESPLGEFILRNLNQHCHWKVFRWE